MSDEPSYPRIRVPREDRALLSVPPLESAFESVERNRRQFQASHCTLHGRPLSELRQSARVEVQTLAVRYTSGLLKRELPNPTDLPLIVAGHQPELFHVGVWAKNFALAGLAKRSNAAALNLIIDNDTLNDSSIRCPVGRRELPTTVRVPFDTGHPVQPWQEAVIHEPLVFEQFGANVRDLIQRDWQFEPLASTAWSAAVEQARVSPQLSDALTAARAHVERRWGLKNLELPMSQLCETDSFLWFASHLLMRLPELHAIYNETVADYRHRYRIRNRMQPVPDLESQNGWCEAPFWIWQRGDQQRDRLFARRNGPYCELRNEKSIVARLPLTNIGPLDGAITALRELHSNGYRLRTRALTTTLFARVCLADLFIHGIGGAKYDEMTDQLCERLFGLPAPRFLLVSATLYLPMGGPFPSTDADKNQVLHQIRDLIYNPERHLADVNGLEMLKSRKAEILNAADELQKSGQLHGHLTQQQHRQLLEIRGQLLAKTHEVRDRYENRRTTILTELNANKLLKNRDYSFLLYPEQLVHDFLMPLADCP